MKTKIQNLIALACVFCLMSCSSDDDNSIVNVGPEGTWSLIELSIETAFDFNEDGTATRNLFAETPCYDGDFVTFDAEGSARLVSALTFISAEVNSPTDYTYVYECLAGFDTETDFTQNGNTITLQLGGNTAIGTIFGNTMTVILLDFFQIEMFNGTEYFDVEEDVTLVYVKQ